MVFEVPSNLNHSESIIKQLPFKKVPSVMKIWHAKNETKGKSSDKIHSYLEIRMYVVIMTRWVTAGFPCTSRMRRKSNKIMLYGQNEF